MLDTSTPARHNSSSIPFYIAIMKTQVTDHHALIQLLMDNPLQPKTIRAVSTSGAVENVTGITSAYIFFTDGSAITLKVGGTTSNGQPALIIEYEEDVNSPD